MIDPGIRLLADIPRVHATSRPDAVAIRFEDRDTTFAELDSRADAAGHALLALNVAPGDRVAWLSRNIDTWFEAFFGAARIRAVFTPLNFRLAPAELEAILSDARPRVLFVSAEFTAVVDAICAGLEAPPTRILIAGEREDWRSWPLLRDASPAGPAAIASRLEDDVLQLYTSGTTGAHKGVRLGNANYAHFLKVSPQIEGFDYDTGDTVLIVMPLFHVAGTNVSFSGLAHGGRVVLVADLVPAEALGLFESERVAHAFLAPAIIQLLLQTPGVESTDFAALRTIAYGASPISEAVLAQAKACFGCDFVQFYGMTESSGGGSVLAPSAHTPDRLRSCGLPWPGLEMKVCGAGGPGSAEAAVGEVGEIAIRGPLVMQGYWNRPEATAQAVVDGWLLTGDAGFRDEAGYFYMHDRVKDMIVSGGENVYPAEVENALFGCPGVADVAVIGVPSDQWGEEVKALVVRTPNATVTPADVAAWARERIAGYKIPKSVEFVDALPRNASGKVLRRQLRG